MMEGDSPPHHFFFAAQSNPTLVTTTSRLIAKPCQRNVPQGQPCNSHYINERISLAIVLDNKLITICTMKISSHKRNATQHIKYDSFICQLHTLHNIFQQRMETYKRTHLMPPLIAYKAGVSRHNNITADKTTPRS